MFQFVKPKCLPVLLFILTAVLSSRAQVSLPLTIQPSNSNQVAITWDAAVGKPYAIRTASSLDGLWNPLDEQFPVWISTNNSMSREVPANQDMAFFSVVECCQPTKRSEWPAHLRGNAYGADVSGNFAYVGASSSGLHIVDVSDPVRPRWLSRKQLNGAAWRVHASGQHAFVATGSGGLNIVDIGDPSNPELVGMYPTVEARDVQVAGDFAYLVDWPSGLHIVDVSNPAMPTLRSIFPNNGYPNGIFVAGSLAYLVGAGLQIIDVSIPQSPVALASIPTSGYAHNVCVNQGVAYVASGNGGLDIFDVNDPFHPVLKSTFPLPFIAPGASSALDVRVTNGLAFIAGWTAGLQIVDVSVPELPFHVGDITMSGLARAVRISGTNAIIADRQGGLQVVDISNPRFPVRSGGADTSGSTESAVKSGGFIYVAELGNGFKVLEQSESGKLNVVAERYTGGNCYEIAVTNDLAFVADGHKGLKVFSITNPANPVLMHNYTNLPAQSLVVRGAVVWFYTPSLWVTALAFTEQSGFTFLGQIESNEVIEDMEIFQDKLFLLGKFTGLEIFDISNPSLPYHVGQWWNDEEAWDLQVSGNQAFIAAGSSGIHVLDVSDCTMPKHIGTITGTGAPFSIQKHGNILHVAEISRLRILNINSITNAMELATVPMERYATDIRVFGKTALVSGLQQGLSIFNFWWLKGEEH